MKISDALDIIKQKYKVDGIPEFHCIHTNLFSKGGEECPLFLIDAFGQAMLTDCADIANGVGFDLTEQELTETARKYGFVLDDWHIKKVFESNDDIKNFSKLFAFIASTPDFTITVDD